MCSAVDKFLNAEIKKYLYCLKKYCFLKVQANSMNNHFSKIIIPKYKPIINYNYSCLKALQKEQIPTIKKR